MPKAKCWIWHTQNRTRKNGDKDGKVLYKLMNNAVYVKTKENLRKWIDVKLLSNKRDRHLNQVLCPGKNPEEISVWQSDAVLPRDFFI